MNARIIKMIIQLRRLITCVCIAVALLAASAVLAYDDTKGLAERAFSDPSQQVVMPKDWILKPITYEQDSRDADISLVMDQDVYHTLLPLIQKYAREHNLKIAAKEGTCGIAAGMLSRKTTDIGGFCCPTGKEDRLPGIQYHTLGIVAKAILVHPDNPIDDLTVDQVRDIFGGKIIQWSWLKTSQGIAGPDRPIRPIGRFHCKQRPGHWYLILPDEKIFGPMVHEVGSIPDMISQVGSQREAIGWEVLSMVERYEKLQKVKPLKINGKLPTDKAAILSRTYPFYRTYNVTTWESKETSNPKAKKLVKYLLDGVEQLDLKFGFVSAARLRAAGWRFKGAELIGEPR